MNDLRSILRLMLVVDERWITGRDLVEVCLAAERGGITSVLLRPANATPSSALTIARAVLRDIAVPLLISGRADVAIAAGAAGVHLGPEDMPLPMARRIAPWGFLIGASVHTPSHVEAGRGADYWAIGSRHIPGASHAVTGVHGTEVFAGLCRKAQGRPCIAFGRMVPDDLKWVLAAGGCGVAVAKGILAAPDPEVAARSYSGARTEGLP